MNVEGQSSLAVEEKTGRDNLALFKNGLASVLARVRGGSQHRDLIPG